MLQGVPYHVSDWMQANMHNFGYKKIKDIMWLPGTRDSGMNQIAWSRGSMAHLLQSQSLSIGDQLLLGARWIEVRPIYNGDRDPCTHLSDRANRTMDCAGGTPIHEIFREIKGFLDTHPELVFLCFTGWLRVCGERGEANHDQRLDPGEMHKSLVKHARSAFGEKAYNPRGNSEDNPDIGSKTLYELIGRKVGKVVIVERKEDLAELPKDFHLKELNPEPPPPVAWVKTLSQDWALQSLDKPVRELAVSHSAAEWPFMPLRLRQEGRTFPHKPANRHGNLLNTFLVDNLTDSALLTVCLAAMYSQNMSNVGDMVIVYGGKLITDENVKIRMNAALDTRTYYEVSSKAMGGDDPWPGQRKCAVVYRFEKRYGIKEPFARGYFAWEGDFDFSVDIEEIYFGNSHVNNIGAFNAGYYNLYRALIDGKPFSPSPAMFNGYDPTPNEKKSGFLTYYSLGGKYSKERSFAEGKESVFQCDIKDIIWGGHMHTNSRVFELFFRRLEARIPNQFRSIRSR